MRRCAPALFLLAACGVSLPDHGPPPTLDGPLLSFDSEQAAQANNAALPSGFSGPQPTVCAQDVTRGFISELQSSFDDPQVAYAWAPMVGGPNAARPTISQPEYFVSGDTAVFERSALDFPPTHPLGVDFSFDVDLDAPYRAFVHNRPSESTTNIHTEIETGVYADRTLGFDPNVGTRILLKGSWIFDCGHPPYDAEFHPPTFVAVASAAGATTTSLAFASPYRVTQLFGPASVSSAFDHDWRYTEPDVAPFVEHMKDQVVAAVAGEVDHFDFHPLLEAIRFDVLTWFVCAPDPKPHGASLGYGYRFVARTGVTVSVARRGTSGCLEFRAEMGPSYQPARPTAIDQEWSWAQISADASSEIGSPIDVRALIASDLVAQGFAGDIPALRPEASPVLGTFAPLDPGQDVDSDRPNGVVADADSQPFPFYGYATVYWK